MIEKIIVEWKYEPKNYFEQNLAFQSEGCLIDIKPGIVTATIKPDHIDSINETINKLHHELKSRFLAVQVLTHQKFNLSELSRCGIKTDGSKDLYISGYDLVMVADMQGCDLRITDKNGNVKIDTKQDRIDRKRRFSEKCAKFRPIDGTFDQMLQSYSAAVNDPNNELVHLYEIRDAASKEFGKDKNAKSHLNITEKEWNCFGNITCHLPLLEGRHRGRNAGELRKAEFSELEKARKIALKIIENYLIYLEKTIK